MTPRNARGRTRSAGQGRQDNQTMQQDGQRSNQDNHRGNHRNNSGNQANDRGNYGHKRGNQDSPRGRHDNQRGNRGNLGSQNHRGKQRNRGDWHNRSDQGQSQGQDQGQGSSQAQATFVHSENAAIAVVPSKNQRSAERRAERTEAERTEAERTDKVVRVEGPDWAATKQSIAFVEEGGLNGSRDTTIITLNLIDHFLDLANEADWNGELSNFKLAATCFFVAGLLTGANNSAEAIARAVNYSVWQHVAVTYWSHAQREDPRQVLDALLVTAKDVERGYAILHEHRERFRHLVGDHVDVLDMLPVLLGRQISLASPTEQSGVMARVSMY